MRAEYGPDYGSLKYHPDAWLERASRQVYRCVLRFILPIMIPEIQFVIQKPVR